MEEEIGRVTHWWGRAGVAGVHVDRGVLRVGDRVRIKGHTTDIYKTVDSMEADHQRVSEAGPGADVGIWVGQLVRARDHVLRVSDDGSRHP